MFVASLEVQNVAYKIIVVIYLFIIRKDRYERNWFGIESEKGSKWGLD